LPVPGNITAPSTALRLRQVSSPKSQRAEILVARSSSLPVVASRGRGCECALNSTAGAGRDFGWRDGAAQGGKADRVSAGVAAGRHSHLADRREELVSGAAREGDRFRPIRDGARAGGYVDVAGSALDAVGRYLHFLRCVGSAQIARRQSRELIFRSIGKLRRILCNDRGEHQAAAGPEIGGRNRPGRQERERERQDESWPDGGSITSGDVVWFQMAGRGMSGQGFCYFAKPPAR